MTTFSRGDTVTIHSPGDFRADAPPHGNPALHGTRATVLEVTDYGYLLAAPAAATGRYRAAADEVLAAAGSVAAARDMGYTGDACTNPDCGRMTMRRNGACLVCDTCGLSSGCS